jgi:hypothetical protein
MQTLGAFALSGVVIYLLVLANQARQKPGSDAQEEAYGLLVGAGVLGAIALPVILSCWGMWKGKAWSWWLALVVDFLGLAVFLRDPIARRVWPDIDELAFIVIFAMALVLLLLAPVRRFFLRKNVTMSNAGAEASQT